MLWIMQNWIWKWVRKKIYNMNSELGNFTQRGTFTARISQILKTHCSPPPPAKPPPPPPSAQYSQYNYMNWHGRQHTTIFHISSYLFNYSKFSKLNHFVQFATWIIGFDFRAKIFQKNKKKIFFKIGNFFILFLN